MNTHSKPPVSLLLRLGLTAVLSLTIITLGILLYAFFELPEMEDLKDVKLQEPMEIYDRNNQLIGLFGEKFRKPVSIKDLPDYVPKAFLAAEDARFYSHSGIDAISLLRASLSLILTGKKGQGGSTITMQLARNFYLSREKLFSRKFIEILLALKIERSLTKDEILELYLNKIFFGYRAYGIAAASRIYFGIEADQLSVAQAATLATLPQRPSGNNPIRKPFTTLMRRNGYVLPRMYDLGHITEQQYIDAKAEKVNATYHGVSLKSDAGYLSEQVRLQLEPIITGDLLSSGYKVYTTLDARMQTMANQALRQGLLDFAYKRGRNPDSLEYLPKPVGEYDPLDLDKKLEALGSYGDLTPAIVLKTSKTSGLLYLGNGETVRLTKKDIRWARPFISANTYGPYPSTVQKALSPGEIVWGKKTDDRFTFIQKPPAEGSIVVQYPHTGEVLVMVGGYDFKASKFNRATQAKRQIGSAIKPFLYTIALENGYTPSTIVRDEPIVFFDSSLEGQWRPDNYGEKFEGPMRLREALVRSKNLVSIRLLYEMGVSKTIKRFTSLGFKGKIQAPRNLSLSLGAGQQTPLLLTTNYATFANGGYRVKPWFISKVVDSSNTVVYYQPYQASCEGCFKVAKDEPITYINVDKDSHSYPPPKPNKDYELLPPIETPITTTTPPPESINPSLTRVITYNQRIIDPRVVFLMNSIMRDVTKRGTAAKIGAQLPDEHFSGKTGTTNDSKDSWFVGFNKHLVASVWVGYDDYTSLGRYESGSSLALPIWINFMKLTEELRNNQKETTKPIAGAGIVHLPIHRQTGEVVDSQNITPQEIRYLENPNLNPNPKTKITPRVTDPSTMVMEYFLIENINLSKQTQSTQDFFQ